MSLMGPYTSSRSAEMLLWAPSGLIGSDVDFSWEDFSLEEKLGGWGLLYLLTKSFLVSTCRRKDRAGSDGVVLGGANGDLVDEGAGRPSSDACWLCELENALILAFRRE